MFGLSLVKDKALRAIKETMTLYQRTLEDIGWINLSMEDTTQDAFIGDGFKKMLKRCKTYYYRNPLAGHWVNLTTDFIFGEGVGIPKSKDKNVQEVIENFWNDPDNKLSLTSFMAQQLLSNKLQYEGNLFFALFSDEEGDVRVRIMNTEEISDIIRDEEDRMRVNFYKVQTKDKKYNFSSDTYDFSTVKYQYYADWTNLEPNDFSVPEKKLIKEVVIFHVKINCDINDKFGVPELYRGLDWLKANKEACEDLATLVRSLSTLAWKKKVKGTPAQVSSIKNALHAKTDLTNIGVGAGSTQVENQGIDTTSVDVKTGGTDINKVSIRQSKLMVCAASGIFEHYFGDPSTGNLATATSMELPMVKKFTKYQIIWAGIFDAVLQYQIIKKIELKVLKGTIEYDIKTRRNEVETDIDRKIDIDFPPILEKDLKIVGEALEIGKRAKLISDETAAQIFLLAANQNNIEEEIEKIDFTEEKSVPGEPGEPGAIPKKVEEKDINEAVEIADRKKAARFAKKGNYVLQRMNGYKKSLSGHLATFRRAVQRSMKSAGEEGKIVGMVEGLDGHLMKFTKGMLSSAALYFPIAIGIGEKFLQAHLKESQIQESIYEARRGNETLLSRRLAWNKGYVEGSLVPDMRETIQNRMRTTYDTADDFHDAVNKSINSYEGRVGQYAGAFWTVEEDAVKEAGKGTGLQANFAGADDQSTCQGCNDAMAGNPYPIDQVPEPGSHECDGNCRHAIQII